MSTPPTRNFHQGKTDYDFRQGRLSNHINNQNSIPVRNAIVGVKKFYESAQRGGSQRTHLEHPTKGLEIELVNRHT